MADCRWAETSLKFTLRFSQKLFYLTLPRMLAMEGTATTTAPCPRTIPGSHYIQCLRQLQQSPFVLFPLE